MWDISFPPILQLKVTANVGHSLPPILQLKVTTNVGHSLPPILQLKVTAYVGHSLPPILQVTLDVANVGHTVSYSYIMLMVVW